MPSFSKVSAACHHCGYPIDATRSVAADQQPTEGDLSLCMACGELAAFHMLVRGWTLRPLTARETDEAMARSDVRSNVYLARAVIVSRAPIWPLDGEQS